MKTPRCFLPTLALGLALLAGCSTINSRIKEKSATFYSLSAQDQARLKQGIVNIGDTPDMVYIALGAPDAKRDTLAKNSETTTWLYKTYYQNYEGSVYVGYHRFFYWDGYLKAWRVYYEPVRQDVYSQHTQDRIRVVFQDGKVTTIDQAND